MAALLRSQYGPARVDEAAACINLTVDQQQVRGCGAAGPGRGRGRRAAGPAAGVFVCVCRVQPTAVPWD